MVKYFNEWLFQKIDYDNDYYIKDVLNEMINHIINFINRYDEIKFCYDIDTVKDKFYNYIYDIYYLKNQSNFDDSDDMYEYFSLKFSEDIVDIFLEFKEISKRNNLSLFHQRNDCSLYIQDFLFTILSVEDPYYDTDESTDEENNLDIHIDETDI